MKFIKQTFVEIKNVLKSKFVMIIGIIMLAVAVLYPVGMSILSNINRYPDYPGGPIIYETAYDLDLKVSAVYGPDYDEYSETITINGITITSNNPFFWNLRNLQDQKSYMDASSFSSPEVYDTLLELFDMQTEHYLRLAVVITTYEDYRADLGWQTDQYVFDKFIYEHENTDPAVLAEMAQYIRGIEETQFKEKYIDITSEERLAALDVTDSMLTKLYDIIESNDFEGYATLRIDMENDNIANYEEQIAMYEETIVKNPGQEENLNYIIEDLKKQIKYIETNNIPVWEYRREKGIIPGDGTWQNNAISDIENNRSQLLYINIVSEEDFATDRYLTQQYGTYEKYKQAIQAQIDEANENILIAQNSLDAEKPDMKYVPDEARSQTTAFLWYSVFVALFAVLTGGWVIAREFSAGTIRLLMIRPKKRIKIIMSKFLAVLTLVLVIYIAGCLLNIVTNGIVSGFADYGFPNFTASGQVGFFAYYLPKFLACIITILIGYTSAFMLSTVTKNMAVSVIVPAVTFIGSFIAMSSMAYRSGNGWIAYTPIPYVQISSFFSQWSPVKTMIERGVPISLTYGIIMMLVFSALFTFIAVWVFKKSDITR